MSGAESDGAIGKIRKRVIPRIVNLVGGAVKPDTCDRMPHFPHSPTTIKLNHSLHIKPPSQLDDIYGVRRVDAMLCAGHGLPAVSVDDGIWAEQLMYAECIGR
jgi:hypothetical protein